MSQETTPFDTEQRERLTEYAVFSSRVFTPHTNANVTRVMLEDEDGHKLGCIAFTSADLLLFNFVAQTLMWALSLTQLQKAMQFSARREPHNDKP